MSDLRTAAYALEIGVPWWLWVMVYARRQAAPLIGELRRWLRARR